MTSWGLPRLGIQTCLGSWAPTHAGRGAQTIAGFLLPWLLLSGEGWIFWPSVFSGPLAAWAVVPFLGLEGLPRAGLGFSRLSFFLLGELPRGPRDELWLRPLPFDEERPED